MLVTQCFSHFFIFYNKNPTIDFFLITYEFLNRISEFICIDYCIDSLVILDPAGTILTIAAFFIFSKDGLLPDFSLKYFNFPFYFLMNIRIHNLVIPPCSLPLPPKEKVQYGN